MKIITGYQECHVESEVNTILDQGGYVVHSTHAFVGDGGGNLFVVFLVKTERQP